MPVATDTNADSSMGSSERCTAVILPAAGSGRRFGAQQNKLFADLAGKTLWQHAAERLSANPNVRHLVMPISETDRPRFEGEFGVWIQERGIHLVPGGRERTDSVRAGLDFLRSDERFQDVRLVAVHDAARPLVSDHDIGAVIQAAAKIGAAVLATPVSSTVKRRLNDEHSISTIDRSDLWLAQTPQVFRLDWLAEAYEKHRGRPATDDAELVERLGRPVALIAGSTDNLKITHPDDLPLAESILNRQLHSNTMPHAD
ncbi:2-C-methyl-D-erythritol 4-phosphate cytidylyltransferase [Stieleria varia]|uniref:2-C-methyl-D-erythritol 4-phosphate cytidylyltransferase n=1 Tax=Stieleria varia TaxID=2528005 RepID=A0A5C6BBB3_9BACT|nr:2-C-methyl-D-erythritol 4-phosphate cytidylyltransferase [Stieleria varia]TWU08559.1 2-C-methyl-D-erythritol 4-phosphate cytidylyltransferase [Stieleria varia]